MILSYIYLSLILLGLCFTAFRSETSLLKGDRFLKFNLLFLGISVVTFFIKNTSPENFVMIGFACIVTISFLFRKNWLLFKYSPLKTSAIVEDSLSRILIPFQKTEEGYTLQLTVGGNTCLRLANFWPNCAIIVFVGDWRTKKVEVLKNLLKKSFSGIFPRPVIKLK